MPENNGKDEGWSTVIEPPKSHISLNFAELIQYKYLIFLFVKRDFQTAYKQTILGPLWFIIQPLMTTGIYSIIFSGVAQIPTGSIPPPMFYLAGQIIWGFFNTILTSNSTVLSANSGLFSKVYFPRLAVPIANSFSKLYQFGVQLLLFLCVWLFYLLSGYPLYPSISLLLFPLVLLQLGLLAIGFGLWASAWTVKYRDLAQLIGFGMSLWMWATPIVYPMSFVTNEALKTIIWLNPVSSSIEIFRNGFTGVSQIDFIWFGYSWLWSLGIFFIGWALYNKAERTYVDVV